MYIHRFFNPINILQFTIIPIIAFILYSGSVVFLYTYLGFDWLRVPWQPLTILGIALAFYVGFKNNSAYDRKWEARKIWGAIVNSSRSWGAMVEGFVTNEFANEPASEKEIKEIKKGLLYRHIAWLYRLKRQLRTLKNWEHDAALNRRYRKYIDGLFPTDDPETELKNFLSDQEVKEVLSKKNVCTQLILGQTKKLTELKQRGLIDDFRHMEMQNMLTDFYTQQGKCERIKNFPLPRAYASVSVYFVYIFIFLLPMGLLNSFTQISLPDYMVWGVVPFTALLGWVFWTMEMVGDYAENPFESLAFDTPMSSLTRTIEIDLREMLDETDLPAPITAKDGFVM